MTRRHPDQDDSRNCGYCDLPVGIYPSGQAALKRDPAMVISCDVCAKLAGRTSFDVVGLAPGALAERGEDSPVGGGRK